MKFCGGETFSTLTFSGQWNSLNSPQLIAAVLLMSSSSPGKAEAANASSLTTPLSSASAHRLLLKSTKREALVDIRRTRKSLCKKRSDVQFKDKQTVSKEEEKFRWEKANRRAGEDAIEISMKFFGKCFHVGMMQFSIFHALKLADETFVQNTVLRHQRFWRVFGF